MLVWWRITRHWVSLKNVKLFNSNNKRIFFWKRLCTRRKHSIRLYEYESSGISAGESVHADDSCSSAERNWEIWWTELWLSICINLSAFSWQSEESCRWCCIEWHSSFWSLKYSSISFWKIKVKIARKPYPSIPHQHSTASHTPPSRTTTPLPHQIIQYTPRNLHLSHKGRYGCDRKHSKASASTDRSEIETIHIEPWCCPTHPASSRKQ